MTKNKASYRKETATEARLRCLEDRRFRRWYETRRLKNENTADSYCQWVVNLTRRVGLDPLSYIALYEEGQDGFDDATQDIANDMVRAGLAKSTIESSLSALNSWAAWCRCKHGREVVIGRAPVASKQQIPAQVALRRVLDALGVRARACLGFRAFAGLRPGILANRKGTNGLRLKHLEGLELVDDGRTYQIEASSLKVNVPAELSKNGMPFFTFLGAEGIDYLRAYLDKRLSNGEAVSPESPVIMPIKTCNRDGKAEFPRRSTLTDPISQAMKSLGLDVSPYIWRSYFKTQLIIAQSKKGLLGEYVEFWMGHNGGIKGVYSFRKEVGQEVVDELRKAYESKALPFLETRQAPGEGLTEGEITRVALETFDVPAEVLDGLDLENMAGDELREVMRKHRDEAIERLVKKAMPEPPVVPSVAVGAAQAARQLVVPVEEVQGYVAQGWRYIYEARLPEGQALVEAPSSVTVHRGAAVVAE